MTAPMTREELIGELEVWPATGRGDGLDAAVVSRLMKRAAEALRGNAQSLAPATWLEHVRAGLQAIVDLKNPMPRAAVREAVAELLASLPTDPATAAPGQSLRVARELARWIGYDWDGLKDYSIVDRGYPEWTTNSRMYQGGRPDLLRLADALLSPDTTVVPSTLHREVEKPRPADCPNVMSCRWHHVRTEPEIGLYLCGAPGCPHMAQAGSVTSKNRGAVDE